MSGTIRPISRDWPLRSVWAAPVRRVADLGDGALDPRDDRVAGRRRAVDHGRYRRDRDAGALGHVPDRRHRSLSCQPRCAVYSRNVSYLLRKNVSEDAKRFDERRPPQGTADDRRRSARSRKGGTDASEVQAADFCCGGLRRCLSVPGFAASRRLSRNLRLQTFGGDAQLTRSSTPSSASIKKYPNVKVEIAIDPISSGWGDYVTKVLVAVQRQQRL